MKNKMVEERFCSFCEYGEPAPSDGSGEELVICSKRGLVKADGVCRKFKYDLLKKSVRKNAELPEVEKIDI